jgi:hypothetical protein
MQKLRHKLALALIVGRAAHLRFTPIETLQLNKKSCSKHTQMETLPCQVVTMT